MGSVEDYLKRSEEAEQPQEQNKNMGRLHLVKKSKKEFICRVCKKIIPPGSICYRQNIYEDNRPFPNQSRVCELCGSELNSLGIAIVQR
jgi:hypothetical protein